MKNTCVRCLCPWTKMSMTWRFVVIIVNAIVSMATPSLISCPRTRLWASHRTGKKETMMVLRSSVLWAIVSWQAKKQMLVWASGQEIRYSRCQKVIPLLVIQRKIMPHQHLARFTQKIQMKMTIPTKLVWHFIAQISRIQLPQEKELHLNPTAHPEQLRILIRLNLWLWMVLGSQLSLVA